MQKIMDNSFGNILGKYSLSGSLNPEFGLSNDWEAFFNENQISRGFPMISRSFQYQAPPRSHIAFKPNLQISETPLVTYVSQDCNNKKERKIGQNILMAYKLEKVIADSIITMFWHLTDCLERLLANNRSCGLSRHWTSKGSWK